MLTHFCSFFDPCGVVVTFLLEVFRPDWAAEPLVTQPPLFCWGKMCELGFLEKYRGCRNNKTSIELQVTVCTFLSPAWKLEALHSYPKTRVFTTCLPCDTKGMLLSFWTGNEQCSWAIMRCSCINVIPRDNGYFETRPHLHLLPFWPFSFRILEFCSTSVSDYIPTHACYALYLVEPWSKKQVLIVAAHLPPPWVVLSAAFFFFLLWCLYSSEVFVFLACLSMQTKAGGPAGCFLSHSYTSAGFQEQKGQTAENTRSADKQKMWGETLMLCLQNHVLP